jgi:AcrR family transcriptional regulator
MRYVQNLLLSFNLRVASTSGDSLRERQKAFARAQLLEEGLSLFDERGYADTTVEELAARCGCAKGTIYAHFPEGKDELAREIYVAIGKDFDRRFAELLESRDDGVIECVDAAAEVLMAISAEPAKGRFFMISAPALQSVLGDTLGRTGRGITAEISRRIRDTQSAGLIDTNVDPQRISVLVLGLLRETGMMVAAGTATDAEVKTALHELLSGVLVPRGKRRVRT